MTEYTITENENGNLTNLISETRKTNTIITRSGGEKDTKKKDKRI